MLSTKARDDWQALCDAVGNPALERDRLNGFVIGIHRRGETLNAHDLKTLMDEAPLPPGERSGLVSFVDPALALLESYDEALQADEEWDTDDIIGPGDLVI